MRARLSGALIGQKAKRGIFITTSGYSAQAIDFAKSVEGLVLIDGNRLVNLMMDKKIGVLTRMNLIMRGIKASNIKTRNGDTLEDNWPYFDENDPQGSYETLYVDAVVSNPPYSQNWEPTDKSNDLRYSRFSLAPKTKADFAFLLHDLYHLKPNGIMTIVSPHGVLFRGGEEGKIRKLMTKLSQLSAIILTIPCILVKKST